MRDGGAMFTTRPASTQSPASVAPPRRGRATRFMALLATATVGAVCMNTAAASAQITAEMSASADITATTTADIFPTAHRVFELKNVYAKQFADIHGGSLDVGARASQWPGNGQPNQRFHLVPSQSYSGAYMIKAQHSNLCLYAAQDGSVIQWTCGTDARKQWFFTKNSDGHYRIKNVQNNNHLHAPDQATGSPLSVNADFGVTDRMWEVREIKLAYSKDTPGVTVPWGAIGTQETRSCNDGWRVDLDSGTWNPRYNNIGDSGVKITGSIFFTGDLSKYSVLVGVDRSDNDPRKVRFSYYQNSGTDSSRNYALTGRVRFYCVPGTTF
jgi:hypothetical protein